MEVQVLSVLNWFLKTSYRFATCARAECRKEMQIHRFVEETNRSIGKNRMSFSGMLTTNVVFKPRRSVDGKRLVKNIPAVDRMNLDLDHMETPTVLFKGPARDCVQDFPQNINIAAALSLAGIGFDKTQIRILADPTVARNTHEIECESRAGKFKMILENIPDPDNPKTTLMACYSVFAALKNLRSHYRVST